MKVISGTLKGRVIPTLKTYDYRPTLSRIREDVFNLIQHNNKLNVNLEESTLGDLFCGTGSIGIEALSRGAQKVIFNDFELSIENDINKVFDKLNKANDISSKIFRLYNSTFGRFPDIEGLKYWIDNNDNGIDTFKKTAESFIESKEFKSLYGENITNSVFIGKLYKNVLGRVSDAEGFNYWVGNLNDGVENRSEILLNFSESNESIDNFTNQTGTYI